MTILLMTVDGVTTLTMHMMIRTDAIQELLPRRFALAAHTDHHLHSSLSVCSETIRSSPAQPDPIRTCPAKRVE
eukprot:543581-Pleurochrysis_carterae.AAC.1